MNSNHPPIVVIVGATASGKSAFAQELAIQKGGEIINADSQQFYRGMDIGTGKVPVAERKVPHHLLDLCEIGQTMTAMDFANRADQTIAALRAKGKVPFIVGGTGLYLRALLEGFDVLPERDPKIRAKLKEQYEKEGGEALHERLKAVDPASALKIHPNDPSRLVRLLEIYELTGKSPSQLMKERDGSQLRHPVEIHWLKPPREELHRRISARVEAMLRMGWLEEVRGIIARGFNLGSLENKPIGYRELAEVVSGKKTMGEAAEQIIKKTQQYAKRQETFFRGMFQEPIYSETPTLRHSDTIRFTGLFP